MALVVRGRLAVGRDRNVKAIQTTIEPFKGLLSGRSSLQSHDVDLREPVREPFFYWPRSQD